MAKAETSEITCHSKSFLKSSQVFCHCHGKWLTHYHGSSFQDQLLKLTHWPRFPCSVLHISSTDLMLLSEEISYSGTHT